MIPCQQCGADNMLGAIFCRSCGGKLDLDGIRPKTVNQGHRPAFARTAGAIWSLVVIVLLLAAVALLVGLFLPPSQGFQPAAGDDAAKAQAEQQAAGVRLGNRGPFGFDSVQLTLLANAAFNLDKGPSSAGGFVLRPEKIAVDILASGYLRLTLKSTVAGQLPMYGTVVGTLEAANGGVTFRPVAVRLGRITLPDSWRDFGLQRFAVLAKDSKELQEVRGRVAALEVREGRLWVTPGHGTAR
jgi:ribosomal protein L40E